MAEKSSTQIILFKILDEYWGLNILDVQEVIRLVEITPVPDAPSFVEGVINLRGHVVFVVNLRKRMQLPPAELNLNTPIIIVKIGELVLGLIVDTIETLVEVDDAARESVPAEFAAKEYMKAVIKLDDKIVFLLRGGEIITGEPKQMLTSMPPSSSTGTELHDEKNMTKGILHLRAQDLAKVEEQKDEGDKIRLIVFLLNNEWYGIEDVEAREVLRSARIYSVPGAPAHVNGMVNVRGDIIPVIDLARFLGLKVGPKSPVSTGKILIGGRDSVNLGLAVDYIEDIIEVDQNTLQPSAELFGEEAKFIKGKLEWENRVITVLNIAPLVAAPGNSMINS